MAGDTRDMSGDLTIYPTTDTINVLEPEVLGVEAYNFLEQDIESQRELIDKDSSDVLYSMVVSGALSMLDKTYGLNIEEYPNMDLIVGYIENMKTGLESKLGPLCPQNFKVMIGTIANTLNNNAEELELTTKK